MSARSQMGRADPAPQHSLGGLSMHSYVGYKLGMMPTKTNPNRCGTF